MGSKKIDLKKLAELVKQNAELKKELEAQGIKIKNLEDFNELSTEAQMATLRENYAKMTEGGIIIPPVECGAGMQWDEAKGECVPIPPKPGQGEKDTFGILKIYADKPGGKNITSGYTEEEFERNYASGKPSEWSYECEYKSSDKLSDVESTFYCKINGFKNAQDTMSVKLLGPDHNDKSKGKWLIFQVDTDGASDDNFQIEDPHPKNHDNHQKTKFTIGESIVGKWIGFKSITFKEGSDRKAYTYLDFPVPDINNPPNSWREYIGIDSVKSLTNGFVDPTGGNVLLRIDGVLKGQSPETKYASLREITSEKAGGTVPQPEPEPTPTPEPEPTPTPTPTPEGGTLIYDSNASYANWNSSPRVIKDKDGDISPNGKGIELHASGSPVLSIDGNGNGELAVAAGGHGRTYVFCKNYSGIYEEDLTFLDANVGSHTLQFRSRHNEGGDPKNRFGGLSFKVSLVDVGTKVELYHNVHTDDLEKALAKKISVNQTVRVRCLFRDQAGGIYRKLSIDYNDGNGFVDVLEKTWSNPIPEALDKASFDQQSYFWQRINPDAKAGKIRMANVKLYSL